MKHCCGTPAFGGVGVGVGSGVGGDWGLGGVRGGGEVVVVVGGYIHMFKTFYITQ